MNTVLYGIGIVLGAIAAPFYLFGMAIRDLTNWFEASVGVEDKKDG